MGLRPWLLKASLEGSQSTFNSITPLLAPRRSQPAVDITCWLAVLGPESAMAKHFKSVDFPEELPPTKKLRPANLCADGTSGRTKSRQRSSKALMFSSLSD